MRIRDHIAACPSCAAAIAQAADDERLLAELVRTVGDGTIPRPANPGSASALNAFPREIAGLRVVRLIAEGGTAVVYEAEQIDPKRTIALKLLRGWKGSAANRREMFEREAEAMARLNHPAIAIVHFAGKTDEGQPFIAMELVSGRPLDIYIREERPTLEQITSLLVEIADAVQHAHAQGVLHRDLKPGNVLIDHSGHAKVLDFGLARIVGEAVRPATLYAEGRGLMGTLPFMAPEQVQGNPAAIDHRCDIYALGALAYDALAGTPPIPMSGLTVSEAAARVCDAAPRPLSSIRADVPIGLSDAILRALEKDPKARFCTASDFGAALRAGLSDRRSVGSAARAALALSALLVAIGGAAAVWHLGTGTPASRPSASDERAAGVAGVTHDLRRDGEPVASSGPIRFVSSFHYIVGDPVAAWRSERATLEEARESRRSIDPEALFRAASVAEAASDLSSALELLNEASTMRGRVRFAAKARKARVESVLKGCAAASLSILDLERTAKVPKGLNPAYACDARLVIAEHHSRCGNADAARENLTLARQLLDLLPTEHPRQWFDQEFTRIEAALTGTN